MTDFKKGDYVVLLSCCKGENTWKDSMPINYCYRLSMDSNQFSFSFEKDINGSIGNGWSCIDKIDTFLIKILKQLKIK